MFCSKKLLLKHFSLIFNLFIRFILEFMSIRRFMDDLGEKFSFLYYFIRSAGYNISRTGLIFIGSCWSLFNFVAQFECLFSIEAYFMAKLIYVSGCIEWKDDRVYYLCLI